MDFKSPIYLAKASTLEAADWYETGAGWSHPDLPDERYSFNEAYEYEVRRLARASNHQISGQVAYEADVKSMPTYHDGTPRKTWQQLGEIARWSWENNPLPRDWNTPGDTTESDNQEGRHSIEQWNEENGQFGAGA